MIAGEMEELPTNSNRTMVIVDRRCTVKLNEEEPAQPDVEKRIADMIGNTYRKGVEKR